MPSCRPVVAELFAGVACVAEGFTRSNVLDIGYLNDADPLTARTYRANGGKSGYDVRDVREVVAADVLAAADGRPLAGLLGCPPCQGWSAAGHRSPADERNALLYEFLRVVETLSPPFFVMENVPGVAVRADVRRALLELSAYRCWTGVLNAAAYGLPQTRQRAIIIAYRRDLGVIPLPPKPTHAGRRHLWDHRSEKRLVPSLDNIDSLLGAAPRLSGEARSRHTMRELYADVDLGQLQDFVTVREAIDDLRFDSGRSRRSDYAQRLSRSGDVSNHLPWGHGDDLVARMRTVAEGRRAPLTATNGRRYYSQAYARLHRDGLAPTVTTNFHNPGSGRFTHYAEHRSLTVREAARLQGFPDDFVFLGHGWQQAQLVGNAFPPPWAEVIGRHVAAQLSGPIAQLAA
jgi:DNA (cytosine-5)-methyltransferase 1